MYLPSCIGLGIGVHSIWIGAWMLAGMGFNLYNSQWNGLAFYGVYDSAGERTLLEAKLIAMKTSSRWS